MFFVSNRPIESNSGRKDYIIWGSEKTGSSWTNPKLLNSAINSKHDEFYPSVSENGNLYFTSTRENGIGSEDIFISRYVDGQYSEPKPLDTNINTLTYEFNAFISPDEKLILFSSYGRDDDMGGGDLYYSRKDENGDWKKSINMGVSINSEYLDYCHFIDMPRKNLYFTSNRIIPINKKIVSITEMERLSNGVYNGIGNIFRVHFNNITFQ